MPPRKKNVKASEIQPAIVNSDTETETETDNDRFVKNQSDSDSDSDTEDVKVVVNNTDSDSDSDAEEAEVKVVSDNTDEDHSPTPKPTKNKAKTKAKAKKVKEPKEPKEPKEEGTKRHVMTPLERVDLIMQKIEESGNMNKEIVNQLARLRKQLDGAKIKQVTAKRAPNAYNIWMREKMAELKENSMNPKERFAECIRLWNENKKLNE